MTIPPCCQLYHIPATGVGSVSTTTPITWTIPAGTEHSTFNQMFNRLTSSSRLYPQQVGYWDVRATLFGSRTSGPYLNTLKLTTITPSATIDLARVYGTSAILTADVYVADTAAYFWLDFGGAFTGSSAYATLSARRVG